jgi:Protein  of unknown function (DUF3018)
MNRASKKPVPAARRMKGYRERLRAAGLRPVQIWLPDTRSAGFIRKCRAQARAIAAHDPGGDELQWFIDRTYEWPKP